MSQENYYYRNNPLFLRNQFFGDNKFQMPVIPKAYFSDEDLNGLRLIGFDRAKKDDEHFRRIVHFFLYDYKFDDIWANPEKYTARMQKYRAMLTPDFSMYIEMHPVMQMYNTFKNRWVGAYYAQKGIRVIPTVNWGLENTFDFCFDGIEKGSIVAVSTYMVKAHNNHSDQKEFFLKGYNEMLRRIEPEKIICYSEPFPEMQGNIVFVDYALSSWRHMDDDKAYAPSPYVKYICGAAPWPTNCPVVRKTGYITNDLSFFKGTGSARGGEWRPSPNKPDDDRLIGKPGEVKTSIKINKNHSYTRLTKIGADGRAVMERHETDHRLPKTHSNPHDHPIDWSKGVPDFDKQINYYNGAPEFKSYRKGRTNMETTYTFYEYDHTNEDLSFHTIEEFKQCMSQGAEVEFCVGDRVFAIFARLQRTPESPTQILVAEPDADDPESTFLWADTADDALEYIIDGVRLRDIITTVEVTDRTI